MSPWSSGKVGRWGRTHLMSALCHPISISLFPKKDSWPTDCFLFCFNHTVFTLLRVWQPLNPLRLRAGRLDGGTPVLLPVVPYQQTAFGYLNNSFTTLVIGNFFSSSISRRTSWYWPRRVIYPASIWRCLYLQGRKYPTHKVYKFLVRRYYHHTSALSSKYPANLN
jgi:hypothetical protein